jgi:hypothetical protein
MSFTDQLSRRAGIPGSGVVKRTPAPVDPRSFAEQLEISMKRLNICNARVTKRQPTAESAGGSRPLNPEVPWPKT